MSNSRWLFKLPDSDYNTGLYLNNTYVNQFLYTNSDKLRNYISCFDKCLEDKDEFKANSTCMSSCVSLANSYYGVKLESIRYLRRSRAFPLFNTPPSY